MRRTVLLSLLALLPGCAEVQDYGQVAVQARRTMNDMQARATMAATCDIALGAYFRELSALERQYVGLVCGGVPPAGPAFARLEGAPGVAAAASMDEGAAPAP
jgi:hypothetical protein